MRRFAIIADDFTGANDTGIQFAKHGISTVAILNSDEAELECFEDAEVVVMNTETRNAHGLEVYQKVQRAAKSLLSMGFPFIYKKIDSTMRGNPGLELLAVMRALNVPLGVLTPVFPANSRMVAGGFLFIQEGPLRQRYSQGLNIVQLVREQVECRVQRLTLEEIRKGVEAVKHCFLEQIATREECIIIADAVGQEDLSTIAQAAQELLSQLILAGSGGLAEELLAFPGFKTGRASVASAEDRLLLVIGSYNPVTAKQVAWLRGQERVVILAADIAKLVSVQGETEIARVVTLAQQALATGNHTAIVLNSLPEAKKINVAEGVSTTTSISSAAGQAAGDNQSEALESANPRAKHLILQALAQITAEVLSGTPVGALLLSGGDTAAFVCAALGFKGIKLEDEIIPGIPIGRLIGNSLDGMVAVTKSGSFGPEDALGKVLQYLERRGDARGE